MKVRQIMQRLENQDPESEVLIGEWGGDFYPIITVRKVVLEKDEDEDYSLYKKDIFSDGSEKINAVFISSDSADNVLTK